MNLKKKFSEIFDEAKPEELAQFAEAFAAPDLPPETLSSVKEKVYAKTGLKPGRKRQKRRWLRLGAIAACATLLVSIIMLVPVLRKDDPGTLPGPDAADRDLSEVPVWENAQYSAETIAKLFDGANKDAVSTNAYTEVYVPDAKYLYIDDIPEAEYLGVYQYSSGKKGLNKKEFKNFIDGFLPNLAKAVDADLPQYEIEEYNDEFRKRLDVSGDIGAYDISMGQNDTLNSCYIRRLSSKGDPIIFLGGEPVQVDQRLSDDEIISSLQSVKKRLFEIFNLSFSDVKITRTFSDYSEHGAEFLSVYFYNENAHPLNRTRSRPVSDYIEIHFDNCLNYNGDIVSDSILTVATIGYYQHRKDIGKEYALTANAKKISIQDAEALLYNGYVFGGHSCPQCMALQDKVSFTGYDFVDLEYVFGYDSEEYKPTAGLPFYAFYKKIGNSTNGNLIYAKTYVPAVEVSGLEEYFQIQASKHKK